MGKAKRFNSYDSAVAENRRIIESYGRIRQEKSTGSSFRNIPQHPQTASSGSSGTGGSASLCPIISCEKDLGTITTATNIDWSVSNFHRCVVGADISFTMTNLPAVGKYEEVILEITQDGTGNRAITFLDSFLNSHVPVINLVARSNYSGLLLLQYWQ